MRMTEDGRKLGTARITNSPARLAAEIKRAGPYPKVVEACYGWYWAADAAGGGPASPAGLRPVLDSPGPLTPVGSEIVVHSVRELCPGAETDRHRATSSP